MALEYLEPKKFFHFFEEFAGVPHGSGHTGPAADYLEKFAKDRGLFCVRDKANNVYIRKPATPGHENVPGVIIQGHLDMVCDKDQGVNHDFLTDGLKLYVDGDYVKAQGTTLGADDGVAVAMGLAVLDSDDLIHGPLEVILTADEEIGMVGASAFDGSLIQGKYMINMDSEVDGKLLIGCCGGLRADLTLPVERSAADGYVPVKLAIKGLQGGHSGEDIHRQRASGIMLLARLLDGMLERFDLRVQSLYGGIADNAICREAEAVLWVKPTEKDALIAYVAEMEDIFTNEYKGVETGIALDVVPAQAEGLPLTKASAKKAVAFLELLPYGLFYKSLTIPNLTETSANPGILRLSDTQLTVGMSLRSNVNTRMDVPLSKVKALAELSGATLTTYGRYVSWENNPDSPLITLTQETYRELFGEEMQVFAIHGGIEAGVFGAMADLDMVSFGPQIDFIHNPRERLNIPSTQKYWKFLKTLINRLAA